MPISEVPVAASASRAPAGIFEGPAPNRPSAGLRSSGITMSVTVPILSAMVDIPGWRIERLPITHPDAALLVEEVQEEYVARYGGRDETPIDPTYFDEPAWAPSSSATSTSSPWPPRLAPVTTGTSSR